MSRKEYFPLFPSLGEEATFRLGRHSCQLFLGAYVPPREELHFFLPKTGSQKKLEKQKIMGPAGCEKPLQLFGAICLGNSFHVARPVPAPQELVAAMGFEHLLDNHHFGPDRARRQFFLRRQKQAEVEQSSTVYLVESAAATTLLEVGERRSVLLEGG